MGKRPGPNGKKMLPILNVRHAVAGESVGRVSRRRRFGLQSLLKGAVVVSGPKSGARGVGGRSASHADLGNLQGLYAIPL